MLTVRLVSTRSTSGWLRAPRSCDVTFPRRLCCFQESARTMSPIELLHMSVFSQSFSPCGRFLAAGNNYGEIAVFSLCAALSADASEAARKALLTFTAHRGPVFCLVSVGGQLLSSGDGEISAWNWAELIKKNVKAVWTKRPQHNFRSSMEIPEINAMVVNPRDNSLLVGGGDNNIHVLDLEHGVFKCVFRGHSDYVHCLSVRERDGEVLSGGEDGAVRMWDSRAGQCVHCVDVHKYQKCARPQFGKWISCLTTDSDWMLCGGAPFLSLWHLRSLTPTSIFPLSGCQRQVSFYQDMILAAGEGAFVSHCLLGGEVKAQIPCRPHNVNSLQLNSGEHQVLTAAGSSELVDVFTNVSYRAFSLSF
ncbi:THO complex subunit 6 homolog isoform X2 [Nerophis ophidion]|uniref:THO complex subunit 6 homolog isoform X2 n=1 Tax=Nerophis ophidion TaxID=159077 RepID=UPI002AE0A13C|nr:THO complex subunit 6 homolog isoform X2 [Nerophis ophidion]